MERKLSLKAIRMRRRFTFSRNQPRDSAVTIPSVPDTSTSRPRSSTTPVSSDAEIAWDSHDAARHYNFTDEPDYFRPASPLFGRQDIDEDLEAHVKHACSLLIQSIDRGFPIWPSFDTELPSTRQRNSSLVQSSRPRPRSSAAQDPIAVQKENPDSGVAFAFQSPQSSRPGLDSFPGAATSAGGRFYGKRSSTPPLDDATDRGRSRGQSFATDVSTPRSRSRSSSPSFFPYSPPQQHTQWTRINDPPEHLLPSADAFLGAEGMTWLRASLDIHRVGEDDYAAEHKPRPDTTQTALPDPAPRRFYSTRQPPTKKPFSSRGWTPFDGSNSPAMDLYGSCSLHSLSLATGKQSRDFSLLVSADRELQDSDSADELENNETIYSVVIPTDDQPRHKRKRATKLLKRLAGLGIRRKETETVESRRIAQTIQAMG